MNRPTRQPPAQEDDQGSPLNRQPLEGSHLTKQSRNAVDAATSTMGAGASTIADYKEAASKSDESSFPEAFAKLKTAVDGFEGDAAAALAYAEEQCKALN